MPEIIAGPLYCLKCSFISPQSMEYYWNGDALCGRCGWEYKAGTEPVLSESDKFEIEQLFGKKD